MIKKEGWTVAQNAKDNKEKIQALSLIKECHSMELDLFTNATVVDDAIRFVSKSNEKQKTLDNGNEDDNESNEPDYDEEDQSEEEQIKINQTDSSDDLNALSKKYLGFSAMKRDVSRLYITFAFYKKIEITEFAGSRLKALFKCHKLLDISTIRINMQYFKSGMQLSGSNAILKDPTVIDDEFLEFQIGEDELNENINFVKMYVAHKDKLIQKYHYEKTRQQVDLVKISNELQWNWQKSQGSKANSLREQVEVNQ